MARAADLHDLINRSSSSRAFFLSLPPQRQMELHRYNPHIRSAYELHVYAQAIEDRRLY